MADISGIVGSAGLALEQQALTQFGAAIQGAGDNLGSSFAQSDSPTSTLGDSNQSEPGIWSPTPYASALASGAGKHDPKLKFLFRVKFSFHAESIAAAEEMGIDLSTVSQSMTFVVKQIDLPKLEFGYEEVNMYNFRTKVLTSIKHREVSMSFYDDVGNTAISFVNAYLQMIQPISRKVQLSDHLEDHGFAFSSSYSGLDTAHRSAILNSTRTGIMSEMIVEQFYLDRTSTDLSQAVLMNSFTFTNPRLTNVDISDQDHEIGGAFNMIAAIVDFDSMNITVGANGLDSKAPVLPGGDMLNAVDEGTAEGRRGPQSQAGASQNPYTNLVAQQGIRNSQFDPSSYFGGNGAAGGGEGISLDGALGMAGQRTNTSLGTGFSQGLAKPGVALVKDSSTSLSQITSLSSRTSSINTGGYLA